MATSIIKQQNMKLEVLWTNPDTTTTGDVYTKTLNPSGKPVLIMARFRLYGGSTQSINYTTAIYYNINNESYSNLVSSIRYDGTNNFSMTRQTIYNFETNVFQFSIGYREETFKNLVPDDLCLIPYQVIAVY